MPPAERVLVTDSSLINTFEGYSSEYQSFLNRLSTPKCRYEFMDRKEAEGDVKHKQIIPYIAAYKDGKVFCYRRKGNETRLHGLWSLGIGGHIATLDAAGMLNDLGRIIQKATIREMNEEIKIITPMGNYSQRVNFANIGIINDNSNHVGQVHVGVLVMMEILLDNATIKPRGRETSVYEMMPLDKIAKEIDDFENWSKIAYPAVSAYIATKERVSA